MNDFVESGGFCGQCREQLRLPPFPFPGGPPARAADSRPADARESRLQNSIVEGWFSQLCLVIGWTLSAVAAVASLANMAVVLAVLLGPGRELERGRGVPPPLQPDSVAMCVAWGVLGFFFFAGLAVVFARTMRPDTPVLVPCLVGASVGGTVAAGLVNPAGGATTIISAGIGAVFGALCEVIAFLAFPSLDDRM